MGSPATVTYGPLMIGVILNVFLYGIMVTQTFLYFTVYKNDKRWTKLLVCFLLLCDTINCAFDVSFLYIPLITNFGNLEVLANATWLHGTDPAMTSIIALCVQSFFAWRVKALTGNRVLFGFIMVFCVTQFFGGLGSSIAVVRVPPFIEFRKFESIVGVWLGASAVADTLIAISLIRFLRKHRTGFSHTDDIVNRLIRITVQTGLVTSLCAITDLIVFVSSPTGAHLIFNLPLSKLYSNSLMSSLNSRAGWQYGTAIANQSMEPQSGQSTRVAPESPSVNVHRSRPWQTSKPVVIEVTETHEMRRTDFSKTFESPTETNVDAARSESDLGHPDYSV